MLQRGFTLVELAIVMIVIGLLIGGVLKGQEMIKNSQVTSTIEQIQSLKSATLTFKDAYRGLPGDLTAADATARIPNCAATTGCIPSFQVVLNNSRINPWWRNGSNTPPSNFFSLSYATSTSWLDETKAYFSQLTLTNLIAHNNSAHNMMPTRLKDTYLTPEYFMVTGAPAGNYFRIMRIATGGTSGGAIQSGALTPAMAARFDSKLDDGNPQSGNVRASAGQCINGVNYNESNTNAIVCDLVVYFMP